WIPKRAAIRRRPALSPRTFTSIQAHSGPSRERASAAISVLARFSVRHGHPPRSDRARSGSGGSGEGSRPRSAPARRARNPREGGAGGTRAAAPSGPPRGLLALDHERDARVQVAERRIGALGPRRAEADGVEPIRRDAALDQAPLDLVRARHRELLVAAGLPARID